jgi:hypothetical protein
MSVMVLDDFINSKIGKMFFDCAKGLNFPTDLNQLKYPLLEILTIRQGWRSGIIGELARLIFRMCKKGCSLKQRN